MGKKQKLPEYIFGTGAGMEKLNKIHSVRRTILILRRSEK